MSPLPHPESDNHGSRHRPERRCLDRSGARAGTLVAVCRAAADGRLSGRGLPAQPAWNCQRGDAAKAVGPRHHPAAVPRGPEARLEDPRASAGLGRCWPAHVDCRSGARNDHPRAGAAGCLVPDRHRPLAGSAGRLCVELLQHRLRRQGARRKGRDGFAARPHCGGDPHRAGFGRRRLPGSRGG